MYTVGRIKIVIPSQIKYIKPCYWSHDIPKILITIKSTESNRKYFIQFVCSYKFILQHDKHSRDRGM